MGIRSAGLRTAYGARAMIYTHVMQKGVAGTQSPLDVLDELRPEEVEAAVEATRRLERAGQPHQSEPAFA